MSQPILSSIDRRTFLQAAAAASATLALPAVLSAQEKGSAPKPLKILILGGTGFLGPAIVRAAQARGHSLTLFNRGKTRTDLFPDVPRLVGNRDPKKDDGIKALEQGEWDVCFDDNGYVPRIVDASASLLAPRVKHYVYVSSISAYASTEAEGVDEKAPVAKLEDPTVEDMGPGYVNYGGLKALCEQAAERNFPGRCTNIRPGYIVGPEDRSDRFTYWPLRVELGGEMLAPGKPTDPIQVIDVRDLGEWMVRVAENRTLGVFNACGPAKKLGMGEMLEACKTASGSDAKFVWVDAAFLAKYEQLELPIWSPYEGKSKGDHMVSNAAAIAAGLKFRPIVDTARDTLEWFHGQAPEKRSRLEAKLASDIEAKVLKDFRG
jgi:2'-hydroxyisoflavone reductase